jgi:hypothetical protein
MRGMHGARRRVVEARSWVRAMRLTMGADIALAAIAGFFLTGSRERDPWRGNIEAQRAEQDHAGEAPPVRNGSEQKKPGMKSNSNSFGHLLNQE